MGYCLATIRERAREAEIISAKLKAKIAELTPEQEAEDIKELLREASCGIMELLDIIDRIEI